MNAPSDMEGQVLAGKYRVERVLGQGGMGIVLAAKHIHLEEKVAVKLMLAEAAFNGEAVARFLREARAAARLESAHVARVTDVGTLEDGRPYMVMEYLDGQDLSQVLTANGPLAIGDAVDYVLQAAEAIAEAHSLGIVHRDLKPSNLFLTRRRDRTPHVKVLDFGISKVSGSSISGSDNAMTRTSAMMGSPLYMSPEQMTSVRDVDGRSDIWALGIILYELVSGAPPFNGETLPQVCGLVLQSEAAPLSSRRAGVPPTLEAVVTRCLAKTPDKRFQNVAEFAVALRELAGRYGRASVERILMLAGGDEPAPSAHAAAPVLAPVATSSTNGGPPATATSVIQGTNAAWGETRPPATKPARRGAALLLAGAICVPLLGASAWWALRPHAGPSPSPESSVTVVTGAQPAPSAPAEAPAAVVPATPAPAATPSETLPAPVSSQKPVPPAPTKKNVVAAPAKPSAKMPAPIVAAPAPAAVAAAAPAAVAAPKPTAVEVKKPSMGGRL